MSTQNPYVPPAGSSGQRPKAALPQPGSSLDFGRSLGFFFQDPNWVQKILVGSLFTILSMFLVGGVFVAGYMARLVRRAAAGEQHPLPEWDDLGGMFAEGLAIVGAYLAHLIPVFVAFGFMVVPLIVLGGSEGEPPPAAALAIIPLMLFAFVLTFAIMFYFTAAFTRLALEQRFAAAFEFQENFTFLKRNIGNFLMAIVAFLAANFIAQFGILLFCIGILPATFWSQCVAAYALGEVAYRDPSVATRAQ